MKRAVRCWRKPSSDRFCITTKVEHENGLVNVMEDDFSRDEAKRLAVDLVELINEPLVDIPAGDAGAVRSPQRQKADKRELDRQIDDYKRRADRGDYIRRDEAVWLLNELIYEREHAGERDAD
jgi:hypothetical protein